MEWCPCPHQPDNWRSIIEHTVSILYFFVPSIQIIPNLHSFQLLVQVQYIPIQSNSFRWHVMIAMRIYLTLFARGCRGGSAAGSRFDCHWAETSWSSCSSLSDSANGNGYGSKTFKHTFWNLETSLCIQPVSWDIMGKALWHDTPTTKEVSAHGSTQGNSWYVRVWMYSIPLWCAMWHWNKLETCGFVCSLKIGNFQISWCIIMYHQFPIFFHLNGNTWRCTCNPFSDKAMSRDTINSHRSRRWRKGWPKSLEQLRRRGSCFSKYEKLKRTFRNAMAAMVASGRVVDLLVGRLMTDDACSCRISAFFGACSAYQLPVCKTIGLRKTNLRPGKATKKPWTSQEHQTDPNIIQTGFGPGRHDIEVLHYISTFVDDDFLDLRTTVASRPVAWLLESQRLRLDQVYFNRKVGT